MRIIAFVALTSLMSGCAAKQLRTDLDAARSDLETCRSELGACGQKLDEAATAQALADKRLAAYRELAQKLRDALGMEDLEIILRNGRLVVQLPNSILFESGKASLSKDGQALLTKLAPVLKEADRNFLIAGHTDNVPVKTDGARFTNNWELSVLRATNAVSHLVRSGAPAARLGAAGYGEFMPDAKNDTDKGKAQNRRLEVIVMPKLDELPPMPEEL